MDLIYLERVGPERKTQVPVVRSIRSFRCEPNRQPMSRTPPALATDLVRGLLG
jgi:hypothetical protein